MNVELPVVSENRYESFDVLVAGGGTAGIAAAMASARNGARTVPLEKAGRLGGIGITAATGLHSFFNVFDANAGAERALPVAQRLLPVAERLLPVAERLLPQAERAMPGADAGSCPRATCIKPRDRRHPSPAGKNPASHTPKSWESNPHFAKALEPICRRHYSETPLTRLMTSFASAVMVCGAVSGTTFFGCCIQVWTK